MWCERERDRVKSVCILDGGAEPHHVTGDAGDRAGSLELDDDEQRAGGGVELRGARSRSSQSHRLVG
eukprot:5708618-Prymnesium_polylepis.2